MPVSLNHSDSGLTIQDLYPDYVWDNRTSGSGQECGVIDSEQQLSQVEEKQDHSGEIDPLDASATSDTEEDNLFQANLINCYLQDVSRFHLLSQEREIELAHVGCADLELGCRGSYPRESRRGPLHSWGAEG